MRAIIPTAGFGSRLRPFTHTVPKVLLQVADKPILAHIIDKLVSEGIDEVCFVVGYLGDMIEAYVRREYADLKASFVEQEEPLGLGHAIWCARQAMAGPDEPLLIILGDTVIEADLSVLHDAQTDLIGVREVDDPHRFGIVELSGDSISAMVEKPEQPRTNLAIVGVYYLRRNGPLFESLQEIVDSGQTTRGEIQLTDALQKLLDRGATMKPFEVTGWYDCGKPETLLDTNRVLLEDRFPQVGQDLAERLPNVRLIPPVYVHPNAKVSDSILGPNVTIADDALISRSIVRNSIVNEGAQLADVLLDNSIIGARARVTQKALRLNVGDCSEVIID